MTPSPATSAPMPAAPDWLRALLPQNWTESSFNGVPIWQWIGIPLCLLAAIVVGWLVMRVGRWMLWKWLVGKRGFRESHLRKFSLPVSVLIEIGFFYLFVELSGLRMGVSRFFDHLIVAIATASVAWILVRLLDLFLRETEERFSEIGRVEEATAMPLVRRTMKAILAALALLMILQNLGYDVTGLLAGLGIGGIAVALAAQKTLANLFGGVALFWDQPVRVGDFCSFGDKKGTIEEIGLRSTRIRTMDRTVIVVPNADFSDTQLENYAARDQIRIYTVLGLRYETSPTQLRTLLQKIQGAIEANPKIDSENHRVRFVEFAASSLNLEVQAYARTRDYGEFTAIREDFYLTLMDLVREAGTGFAFPSQTIYLGRDTGIGPAPTQTPESSKSFE